MISDTDVAAVYDANGSTDTFAIPFAYILADASNEVKVYVVDEDEGILNASTLQVEGADYDLSPSGDTPANVIFGTAPVDGNKVVVIRALAYTQTFDGEEDFRAEDLETCMDRLALQIQQLEERLDRTVEFSILDKNAIDFKLGVAPADSVPVVNEDGDALEWADLDGVLQMTSQTSHTFTNNQSATDLLDVTMDGAAYTSRVFEYEALRGSVMYNGRLILQYLSSTWQVIDGGYDGDGSAHGLTFSVTQASTVGQLRLASDNGGSGGTVKIKYFNFVA